MEASRSWEVTAALWAGRATTCRLAPARKHDWTESKQKLILRRKKKHVLVQMQPSRRQAQMLIVCSCSAANTALQLALHSPLIVFVVSGFGSVVDPPRSFRLLRYHA